GGYATAKFDGGNGYAGNGTLEASAYIAEFDTTLTVPVIKIDKFKFDDSDLNKCYNLADNTALIYGTGEKFRGVTIPVVWKTHVYYSYSLAKDKVDMDFIIGEDFSAVETWPEEGHVDAGITSYNGKQCYYESDYVRQWKNTYSRKEVTCGWCAAGGLNMDYVGYLGLSSAVREDLYYTQESSTTSHVKYYLYNNNEREYIGSETKNSTSGPYNLTNEQWWNSAYDNDGCTALFEENGKIIYLFYIINGNNKLYVKAVFDKEGNTVNY
ncbi:MAG: hypothetical protein IKI16_02265, partial [Prevotella sp.]|nr:hypothetical protein [Prevotella sp.]